MTLQQLIEEKNDAKRRSLQILVGTDQITPDEARTQYNTFKKELHMNPEVQALIAKYRKRERDLKELKDAKRRQGELKEPDKKLLKMIDEEIANLEKVP